MDENSQWDGKLMYLYITISKLHMIKELIKKGFYYEKRSILFALPSAFTFELTVLFAKIHIQKKKPSNCKQPHWHDS